MSKSPQQKVFSAYYMLLKRDDDVNKIPTSLYRRYFPLKWIISYHGSCRANFSSKTNINEQQVANVDSQNIPAPGPSRILSRIDTQLFDIQRDIFNCGPEQDQNIWQPLWLVQVKSTRDKVLHAIEDIDKTVFFFQRYESDDTKLLDRVVRETLTWLSCLTVFCTIYCLFWLVLEMCSFSHCISQSTHTSPGIIMMLELFLQCPETVFSGLDSSSSSDRSVFRMSL